MVFDGKNVPAKHRTNTKRLVQKYQARREGMQLLRLGKRNEAIGYFNKCVDITPEMAARVLKEYHKLNIDCIVAPYEADAQMAFLNINGIADFVITEDSDLLVFGCNKVSFLYLEFALLSDAGLLIYFYVLTPDYCFITLFKSLLDLFVLCLLCLHK